MSTLTAQTFPRQWLGLDGQWSQLYPATNVSNDGAWIYFIQLTSTGGGPFDFTGQVARASASNPSTVEVLSADYYPLCPFTLVDSQPAHFGMYVAAQHAYYFCVVERISPPLGFVENLIRVVRYDIDADTFTWSGRLVTNVADIMYSRPRLMYDETDDVILTVQATGGFPDGNIDLIKLDATTLAIEDRLADAGSSVYWDVFGAMVLNPTRRHLIFAHHERITVVDLSTFTIVQRITGETDMTKGTLDDYGECVAHGNYLWAEAYWSAADVDIRKYTWNGAAYVYTSTPFDSTLKGFGWPSTNYCPSEDALVFVGYTNGDDIADPNDMALQLIDVDTDEVVDDCPFGDVVAEYASSFILMVNPAGGMFVMGPGFVYSDAENYTSDMWTYVPSLATVTRQPQVQIIA